MKRHASVCNATLFSYLTRRPFVFIHLRAVLLFLYHGVRFGVCAVAACFWATSFTVACHEIVSAQFPDRYVLGWICAPVCVIPSSSAEAREGVGFKPVTWPERAVQVTASRVGGS